MDAPDSTDVLVRATALTKKRGDHALWTDLTFRVETGATLAITGPSGAGKSTLLHCIGLLESPDGGTLHVAGTSVVGASTRARRESFRRSVGHLFQNYALVESWTVDRNLDVAFTGRRVPRGIRNDRRVAVLHRVGLTGFGSRYVHTLSGGEQQRVALARILLKRPCVVVADEPSAALDIDNVAIVLDVLRELRDSGSAIVIATHDESVAAWCDARLVLG